MQAVMSQGMQNIREGYYTISNNLKNWRDNIDVFQKVALIASSALQIWMRESPLPLLSQRLIKTLETVNMHDFFGVLLKNPYSLFCPIKAEDIDEDALFQRIDCSEKKDLGDVLKAMKKDHVAFRNVKELQEYLKDSFEIKFSEDLDDTCIRKKSWLQHLSRINWWIVDIGCVVSYLKEWNFIDTGKIAACLGQVRVLSWIPKCNLDTCVLGSLFSAFVLNCVHAVARLRSHQLTKLGERRALWDIVSSGTDAILYGTSLLKKCGVIACSDIVIHSLTIVVKSIGIVCCLKKPEHEFFNNYKSTVGVVS